MKHFILGLSLCMSVLSVDAKADHTIPAGASTFCSMAARDGYWAFSYGNYSIDLDCRRTEQAIRWVTFAPIHRQNYGFYSTYGWNEVTASCYPFTSVFTGRGVEPLQRAYYTLRNTAQDCVFFVRY